MKTYLFIFLIYSLSLFAQNDTSYILKHFNISLPIQNNGELSYLKIDDSTFTMQYDNKTILFSGGFFLSGYSNKVLWANGVASATRIQDYLPGSYKYIEHDNLANLHIVKKTDKVFSESWQNWKDAVKLGADFHDGNKDGIYNPIDLNKNNKWDYNEDRPDLIGEETIWCIYKDAVPSSLRRYSISPKGIEVQQTIFTTRIKDIIFIRYRIENSGLVSNVFDSVYFSMFSDADIGDYNDDLIGCDTTINSGYTYQKEDDEIWGESAPTFLTSILQGPQTFIPGKTFIDNNKNEIFDDGDKSLTSAKIVNGFIKGTSIIDGAINLPMTSFYMSPISHTGTDPDTHFELRNNQLGLSKKGESISPCDWSFGKVFNEDCNSINGLFTYSGDPLIPNGWINIEQNDQRMMVNTGPFQLNKNQPIDIIVAYVVGYNDISSFSSLQNAKQKTNDMLLYFLNNQLDIIDIGDTVAISTEPKNLFGLKQNYPNPFNSTTRISYAIPFRSKPVKVTVKVYNLLGEVVSVLVDEVKSNGIYTVDFSSGNLPSGIYIISLLNLEYTDTKKMIVLK